MLPEFASQVTQVVQDLQENQNPPYSDGIFYIEVLNAYQQNDGWLPKGLVSMSNMLVDPLMARLVKKEGIYLNHDATKYSVCKIHVMMPNGQIDEYF